MSLFVSFTLTPMLCSRFLKLEPAEAGQGHQPKSKSGFIYRLIDGGYGWCSGAPCGSSSWSSLLTIVVIASTVPIGKVMGLSLIPRDDQSEYEVTITTPEGYSLERTSKLIRRARGAALEAQGDAAHLHDDRPDRGGPGGQGRGGRHPGDDLRADDGAGGARLHPVRVQQQAREMLVDYPDLRASVNDVSPFQGGRRPQTFQVNLAGPRPRPALDVRRPADRRAEEGTRIWSTSTRRSRCASPRSR